MKTVMMISIDDESPLMHDSPMSQQASATPNQTAQRLATEMFLKAAGPALVKSVAEILGARRIPVMPLKGVLLQKLVYGDQTYRPISDVDLLVPESSFVDAVAALAAAGFTESRWEQGAWQVTIRRPQGPPLGVDLHRRLTRTSRSDLTSAGLFARGVVDTDLFSAPVVLPSPDDLFAHLLLHATLHWLNVAKLHRTQDFQAIADALSLDPRRCAEHLTRQGLTTHALLMLPMIADSSGSSFASELESLIDRPRRAVASARLIRVIVARFAPHHPARRLAGLALAPSLSRAAISAALDRLAFHV